jgi:hypothetical protein
MLRIRVQAGYLKKKNPAALRTWGQLGLQEKWVTGIFTQE